MTLKFLANIKNLKIFGLDNQMLWERYKDTLVKTAKLKNTVEVIVRQPRKKITDPQRAYLFGVAYKLIGDEVGMTPEEVHYSEPLVKLRLDYTKRLPTPKSVSRQGMTVEEFTDYKNRIQIWAAQELNLNIPDPEVINLEDV